MVQRGDDARFLFESTELVRRAISLDDLDGDVAAKAWIASAVYLAHAPGAEQTDDLVGTQTGARNKSHVVCGRNYRQDKDLC